VKIDTENGQLTISLPSVCTIAETEADADKLRTFFKEPEEIIVYAEDVDEMDTAYFQLLLSLKTKAYHKSVPFSVQSMSPAVREIIALYGIELS